MVKHVVDRNVDVSEDNDKLVIELDLSQNAKDGLLLIKLISSCFIILGLLVILLGYFIESILFFLVGFLINLPFIILYFYYKKRVERITFDKTNDQIILEKIAPKMKILKRLKISEVQTIYLFERTLIIGYISKLKLKLKNNHSVTLFRVIRQIGNKLEIIIINFLQSSHNSQ